MRTIRRVALGIAVGMSACATAGIAWGQIVINELVADERGADSTQITDTREFVELYNAGASAVDLTGWAISTWDLDTGVTLTTDVIPSGSIPSGGYYVIGAAAVPNVNYTPAAGELWDNTNIIFELRNSSSTLVDALGVDTFRGVELQNATQEQLDQIAAGQTVGATARGGWWGDDISINAISPNVTHSLGRFKNGVDTNVNGRDFGMLPITPGASNNLPQNAAHSIPDVDSTAVGTALGTNYYASFVLPRVVDPTVSSSINPKAITASPQGGRAIMAWDDTGGGNAVYSKELVKKFDLYAYIDTADLNLAQTAVQYEQSTYGIGTTDPFYGSTNPAGLNTLTSTQNGNTGIGWHLIRSEAANGGATTTLLQLIDFNDGGDSVQADADWQILQTIDLSAAPAAWHYLGVDYDPATGNVVAKFDAQTFNFTTATNLLGTFYVGYRENLPGVSGSGVGRPPTYDLYVAAPAGVPGDYNGNGVVDAADYVLWRNGGPLQNEVDTPGTVNAADYSAWRARFGNTAGSGSGLGGASVPEPAAMALWVLGFAAVTLRRAGRVG